MPAKGKYTVLVHPEAVLDGIQPLYPSGATAAPARESSWAERERFEDAVAVLRRLIGIVRALIEDRESRGNDGHRLREYHRRFVAEELALRAEHIEQVNRVLTAYRSCIPHLRDALLCDQR